MIRNLAFQQLLVNASDVRYKDQQQNIVKMSHLFFYFSLLFVCYRLIFFLLFHLSIFLYLKIQVDLIIIKVQTVSFVSINSLMGGCMIRQPYQHTNHKAKQIGFQQRMIQSANQQNSDLESMVNDLRNNYHQNDNIMKRFIDHELESYKQQEQQLVKHLLKSWTQQNATFKLDELIKPEYIRFYKEVDMLSARVYARFIELIEKVKKKQVKYEQTFENIKIRSLLQTNEWRYSYDRFFFQQTPLGDSNSDDYSNKIRQEKRQTLEDSKNHKRKQVLQERQMKRQNVLMNCKDKPRVSELILESSIDILIKFYCFMFRIELISSSSHREIQNKFILNLQRILGKKQKKMYFESIQFKVLESMLDAQINEKKFESLKYMKQYCPNYYFYKNQIYSGEKSLQQYFKNYYFFYKLIEKIQQIFPIHSVDSSGNKSPLNYVEKRLILLDEEVGLNILISAFIFLDFLGININFTSLEVKFEDQQRWKKCIENKTVRWHIIQRMITCLFLTGFSTIAIKLNKLFTQQQNLRLIPKQFTQKSSEFFKPRTLKRLCFLEIQKFPASHRIFIDLKVQGLLQISQRSQQSKKIDLTPSDIQQDNQKSQNHLGLQSTAAPVKLSYLQNQWKPQNSLWQTYPRQKDSKQIIQSKAHTRTGFQINTKTTNGAYQAYQKKSINYYPENDIKRFNSKQSYFNQYSRNKLEQIFLKLKTKINKTESMTQKIEKVIMPDYSLQDKKIIYTLLQAWKNENIDLSNIRNLIKEQYFGYYKQIDTLSARVYVRAMGYIDKIKDGVVSTKRTKENDDLIYFIKRRELSFSYDRYFFERMAISSQRYDKNYMNRSQSRGYEQREPNRKQEKCKMTRQFCDLINGSQIQQLKVIFKFMLDIQLFTSFESKKLQNRFMTRLQNITKLQQKSMYLESIQFSGLEDIIQIDKSTAKPEKKEQKIAYQWEVICPNYYFYAYHISQGKRSLHQYFENYNELESMHDYIQWMFPNHYQSSFNEKSFPMNYLQKKFFLDEDIGLKMLVSIYIFFDFLGIRIDMNDFTLSICSYDRFLSATTVYTHNNYRIRRVLACLSIIGFRSIVLNLIKLLDNETSQGRKAAQIRREYEDSWEIYGSDKNGLPKQSAKQMCFLEDEDFPSDHPILTIARSTILSQNSQPQPTMKKMIPQVERQSPSQAGKPSYNYKKEQDERKQQQQIGCHIY